MKTPPRLTLLFLLLATAALPLRASSAAWPLPAAAPAEVGFSAPRLGVLHQAMDRLVDNGTYSGYVSLVARDGRIADWRAGGWQDLAAKTPMTRNSIFRIYSMSKIVTSVAVLTLMEDGKLKLDDPVEKYLPALKDRKVLTGGTADFPALAPADRPITLLDLLTHTSGYYYDQDWSADSPVAIELFQRAKIWEAKNLAEFVARVAELPLLDQPGTRFRYGINMDLLGAIVEKVSGERFGRYLQERIFDPLGLRDTGFSLTADQRRRLALTYKTDTKGKLVPAPDLDGVDAGPDGSGLQSGGGGLYSTAADYARFAQMLLNGGQLDGVRILSRKSVELMTQNHIAHLANPHPFDKPEQGYGLGVRVTTDLGRSPTLGSVGQFGWDGAATTLVQIDPKEHTVAILLTQHFPWNEDDIFATFTNGYYAALSD